MDSITGLTIQFAGVFLIATLFVFLTDSLKSTALNYWKCAWLSLSGALLCLLVAFNFEQIAKPFFALYYLGEYVFAYLIIAGCRNYAANKEITVRSWLWLFPGILTATVLAFPIGDFNDVFNFHSFILAVFFAIAFFTLKPSRETNRINSGYRVMKVALALLALNFFHYTIIFSLRHTSYPSLLAGYLTYNSIIDLVLEILLGFGTVIVLLERVRQDVEEINDKLKKAHDQLEKLAHVDPLTAAFSRHAFYGFLQKHNREDAAVSGCVGVFDIDNLKPINDNFGHQIGDVAISSVAHAIRSLIRADDLLFRWGGDEFFVVMLGFDEKQAFKRMCELNSLLEAVKLRGLTERISIKVSFGFTDFESVDGLEKAVEIADAKMYKAKQENKCRAKKSKANNVYSSVAREFNSNERVEHL
jgi:diguanylate cyclase (GGDEF)-like protein